MFIGWFCYYSMFCHIALSRKKLDVSTICALPAYNSTFTIKIKCIGIPSQTISTNNRIIALITYEIS